MSKISEPGCANGCAEDAVRVSHSEYNVGSTRERKIGSSEGSLPPLPEPIMQAAASVSVKGFAALHEHPGQDACQTAVLQQGCYYLRLIPTSLQIPARYQYEGTLRVQRTGTSVIASGDLYKKDSCKSATFCPPFSENKEHKGSIPVFSRCLYAYYLRVTRIQENQEPGQGIWLQFESFRFYDANSAWGRGEILGVEMKFSTGPDSIHYWRGDLQTSSGIVMGHLQAVRVSPFLRQAVIEIDRVAASECPAGDGDADEWQGVFQKAGWDVAVEISDADVEEPEDHSWSNAELHKKMLAYRKAADLDREWRYHLLAVRYLDDQAFGVMYDNTINGMNGIPREGAAISSHVKLPDDPFWGKCSGKRFGECTTPYLRTAIHEIGHAMMLYHPDNAQENHIMQKTVQIAHNAQTSAPPQQFPDNIEWSFSPRDTLMLCHLPDIPIRPGGVSFGTPHDRLPVNVRDEIIEVEGLQLQVSALCDVVPIGAPVRVNFTLINTSDKEILVPGSLSMKTGHVSGRVIDPMGTSQDFATIIRYTGDVMPQKLPPKESISHSVTLLWGTHGPLFPTSGYYRIILELGWYLEGVRMRASGFTSVMIMPPKDEEHARIALKIFSNPDTLLALAIGGEHLKNGYEGIQAAIKHEALKPHYDLIEAKRVGQRYFKQHPDLKKTAEIVDEQTVMSQAEVIRLAKILGFFAHETEKPTIEKLKNTLLTKAKALNIQHKVQPLLHKITNQPQQKKQ